MHVAITVTGEKIIVDFAGSDDRPELNAWSTFGNTRGYTIAQLASLVDPSIPKNEGFFDCIDLRVPEGTCLNPGVGKPVSAGTHHPGVEVADAIAIAMSQIIPDRCSPQTYKYGSPRQMWGAKDPRTGQSFFDHGGEVNAGWVNAVRDVDGWGALVAANGNLIKASAEINEALFPHIMRGRNYRTDSGGAGQWRGGCGSHFVKEVRTPTYVNQYVVNQRHLHPGIAGGHDGAPDRCVISEGTERGAGRCPLGRGGAHGDRRPARLRLRRWRRMGRPSGSRSVGRARGRLGRVRVDRRRSRRVRSRRHRFARSDDARARRRRHPGAPHRASNPTMTEAAVALTYRIGVDVGGTFTDVVAIRSDGVVVLEKTPTTPSDQSDGVLDGIARIAAAEGYDSTEAVLARTTSIVHGTTTGDNTMIQMSGASTGLLVTAGFRDEIEMRRCYKEDIWDPALGPPEPIARRRVRLEISERMTAEGEIDTPLDDDEVPARGAAPAGLRRHLDRDRVPPLVPEPGARAARP